MEALELTVERVRELGTKLRDLLELRGKAVGVRLLRAGAERPAEAKPVVEHLEVLREKAMPASRSKRTLAGLEGARAAPIDFTVDEKPGTRFRGLGPHEGRLG
ncbi:MAG: hypothetical protein WEF50_19560 [Myxococcota bacterium]